MTCPKCGSGCPDDARYCPNCGSALQPGTPAAPPPQAPSQPPQAPPPPPAPQPVPATASAPRPVTSSIAVWSLVLGLSSFFFFCCCPFTAIPAIICGHVARANIRKSAGRQTGDGLALAGLIIGYIGVAFTILAIAALVAVLAINPDFFDTLHEGLDI